LTKIRIEISAKSFKEELMTLNFTSVGVFNAKEEIDFFRKLNIFVSFLLRDSLLNK